MWGFESIYQEAFRGAGALGFLLSTGVTARPDYGIASKAPLFTNENHKGLEGRIDYKNKKVFGVLGSGDHLIEAIAGGCSEYTTVDVSVLSFLFTELKLAAVKTLDYDEFREFFGIPEEDAPEPDEFDDFIGDLLGDSDCLFDEPDRDKCGEKTYFKPETYGKIEDELSGTARAFFTYLFNVAPMVPSSPGVYKALDLIEQTMDVSDMENIPYLRTRTNYEAAQQAIRAGETKINYHIGGALEVLERPDKIYDVIYNSNLLEYQVFKADDQQEALSKVTQLLISKLNPDGIVIDYAAGAGILHEQMEQLGLSSEYLEFTRVDSSPILLNDVLLIPQQEL